MGAIPGRLSQSVPKGRQGNRDGAYFTIKNCVEWNRHGLRERDKDRCCTNIAQVFGENKLKALHSALQFPRLIVLHAQPNQGIGVVLIADSIEANWASGKAQKHAAPPVVGAIAARASLFEDFWIRGYDMLPA